MRKLKIWGLCIGVFLVLAAAARAEGAWTANQFVYKPPLGARGEPAKALFDSGLDRIDARLGKEIWVGDPNYGATLPTAVAAIGSTPTVLRVPTGTYNISADLIGPTTLTLKPERGAILNLASAKTLTLSSAPEAGLYQIFSGPGQVVFSSPVTVYPEWWGAKGDNSTDDRAAIQAALDCLQNGAGGSLVFSGKTYKVNSFHPTLAPYTGYDGNTHHPILAVGLNSGPYKTIKIIGRDGAVLTSSLLASADADITDILTIMYRLQDVEVSGLTFQNTHGVTTKQTGAIATLGAGLYQVKNPLITNCRFKNFSRAVYIPWCDGPVVRECAFTSDLGRDSGSSTNNAPNVGIMSNDCSRNVKVLHNDFDGCVSGNVTDNAEKSGLDGLYWGMARGVILEGNSIRNFGYEGIFVLPATLSTIGISSNNFSAIVQGNLVDATLPTGATVLVNYGLRCDESNSLIHANIIKNAIIGILVQREAGYATDIYRTRISENIVNMHDWDLNTAYGICINGLAYDFTLTNNDINWTYHSSSGACSGIRLYSTFDTRLINNRIKTTSLQDPSQVLWGIYVHNSCQKLFFNNNETAYCTAGLAIDSDSGGPQGLIEIDCHTFTGCGKSFEGSNLSQVLWHQQKVVFTPAVGVTGYYRFLTRPEVLNGRLKVRTGTYDNTYTDVVAEFNYGGYGVKGAINQVRYSKYNGGVISKIRCGGNADGWQCYLDINVSTATAPQPIEVYLENNEEKGLVLADPPAFSPATPSNIVELTCGAGLVSTETP